MHRSEDNPTFTAILDTPEKIAMFRAAVEAEYARGRLTREQRAICVGNLDNAAALLRLRAARN